MALISDSDVEKVINRAVGANAKILDYKLEPFSENKCGILGSHLLLSVNVEDEINATKTKQLRTYTFFVKSLGDVNDLPKFVDAFVFQEEINYYNNVQPLLLADYKGDKWSTKCFFAEKNILILEDLRAQGYTMQTELVIDACSLIKAAGALARFHACSVMAEIKLGQPLNKSFPNYFVEKIYTTEYKFGQSVKVAFETVILMAIKLGLDPSLVPQVYEYIHKSVRPREDEFNVICHSDVYRNNILFNDTDTPVLVDYQLLRYAPPAVDISLLLYMNTSTEFRQTYDMAFLRHYYSVFREILEQSKANVNIPSYECMLEKYHKYKIVGMATAVNYLPAHYLGPEDFFKLVNDPQALEEFMMYDRMKTIGPKLDINSEYAKKVKDLLSEFLDEGKRVLNL